MVKVTKNALLYLKKKTVCLVVSLAKNPLVVYLAHLKIIIEICSFEENRGTGSSIYNEGMGFLHLNLTLL
jgi:hypothetical protein